MKDPSFTDFVRNLPDHDKIFVEEWNKIFPHGIDHAINKMYEIMKNNGHLEKWQDVINRSLKIMYEGLNE
jgi:hypothetical protein